jgi:hypothetical protein
VTGKVRQLVGRGLAPRAAAVASAGCLAALMATGTAAASASQTVLSASLSDVSCTSASSCMAVGTFLGNIPGTKAYQNFTLAETWNGSAWKVVPSPSPKLPAGGAILNSVSCSSATSCVAVGNTLTFHEPGGYTTLYPLIEAWNGTVWKTVAIPKLAKTGAALNGVSCTSATRCMAVGSEGTPKKPTLFTFAESWNGSRWKFVPTPAPLTPGGTALNQVSCTSSSACMAAGYYGYNFGTGTSVTLAEAWNGAKWQRLPTPVPGSDARLNGVSCTAAPACTAVGGRAENSPTLGAGTLAQRWNGTKWATQPSPNPSGAGSAGFAGVSCPSATACMATGSSIDQTGESQFTLAESWNGTGWKLLNTPNPSGSSQAELLGVSCTSPSGCMAVGGFVGSLDNMPTLAERWNGTHWAIVKTPHP